MHWLMLLLAAGPVDPQDAADRAAEALCEKDAACEGDDCYRRARCVRVERADFSLADRPVVKLVAERPSDGEGNLHDERYYALFGSRLVSLFTVSSDSGGDGPHSSVRAHLVECAARSHGLPEFDVISDVVDVEAPTTAEGSWTKTDRTVVEHYAWNGTAFVQSTREAPCPEPAVPVVPAWFARASARTTLVEKGLPADYYLPERAIDGLTGTTWAEGAKGPGLGEWLRVEFTAPLALKALRVQPGCGVNAAVWKKNERLKAVRVTFADGTFEDFALKDAGFGEWVRLALARTAPTSGVTLTVSAVYPAKFQDACMSEVDVEVR